MSSQLMTHKGSRQIERNQLELIEAPSATSTWFPVKHSEVLAAAEQTLERSGFGIERSELSVSPNDLRFFGVLDLSSDILPDVTLSVGLRNSNDKTFPLGLCAGSRTFVCDNLMFSSEIIISKKHTRFGEIRYREGIANAVSQLGQFQAQEADRLSLLQTRELTEDKANSAMLQAFERGIVGTRMLPNLIREWRQPSHDVFAPRTAYSLLNAFTELAKPRFKSVPHRAAHETMQMESHLLTVTA